MGGLLSRGPSIGERPQHVQGAVNVSGQGDGIERVKLRGEGLLLVEGEAAGRQDPLVRVSARLS